MIIKLLYRHSFVVVLIIFRGQYHKSWAHGTNHRDSSLSICTLRLHPSFERLFCGIKFGRRARQGTNQIVKLTPDLFCLCLYYYLSILCDLCFCHMLESHMSSITDPDTSIHNSEPSLAKHRTYLVTPLKGICIKGSLNFRGCLIDRHLWV